MLILPPNFGANLTRRRWLVPAAMSGAAVVAALLQLTSLALFPADRTDTLTGIAAGMVLGTAVLWLVLRDEGEGESR